MRTTNDGLGLFAIVSVTALLAVACSDDSPETTGTGGTGATGGSVGTGATGGDGGSGVTGGMGGGGDMGGTGGTGGMGGATGGGGAGGMADPLTVLVDFEGGSPATLIGFGGAEDSTVVADPTNAGNQVAKIVKSDTAELWAGTTVAYCPNDAIAALPFSATEQTMSLRVWSPDAGIPVRFKVENASDAGVSVETEATTTAASQWETLVFDFGNEATGTAALDLGATYNKASVFFNFGTTGAMAGEKTYYLDDVTFLDAVFSADCPTSMSTVVLDFDDPNTTYTLTGFGGAEDSTVVADPNDATNNVARVVKSSVAELWAGTTTSTGPNFSIPTLPITATDTQMTVRVWADSAGIPVRLKVEDAGDPTHSCETEAVTTVAMGWETLTFDFANEASGTAVLDPSYTFDKISIFFDFGTTGADGGDGTFYYDDMSMVTTP